MTIEPGPRFDETFDRGIGMQVENYLVAAAVSFSPFRVKMNRVFSLGFRRVCIIELEVFAVAFEISRHRFASKIIPDNGVTRQHARAAVLNEILDDLFRR